MIKMKLIKALSWSDSTVKVTAQSPIVTVKNEQGEKMLKTGYFEKIEETEDEPEAEATEAEAEAEAEVDLNSLSVQELTKMAKELGIETKGLKKDDLVREISVAQGGSATMIDLQTE